MSKAFVLGLALAAVGAAAATEPARAGTFSLVYGDSYTLTGYSVPLGDDVTLNDSASSPAVSNESGEAGEISTSWTNTSVSPNTTGTASVWCSYIQAILTTGPSATFTLGYLSSTLTDATKVNQINALLYNGGNPSTADASAALQAAIWEVEYSSGDTSYTITTSDTTGILSISGLDSTALADANQDLANIVNGTWKADASDSVYQFEPTTAGANQALIYLGASQTQTTGNSTPIPEPGSLALLATGLAGFVAVRRRRRRA